MNRMKLVSAGFAALAALAVSSCSGSSRTTTSGVLPAEPASDAIVNSDCENRSDLFAFGRFSWYPNPPGPSQDLVGYINPDPGSVKFFVPNGLDFRQFSPTEKQQIYDNRLAAEKQARDDGIAFNWGWLVAYGDRESPNFCYVVADTERLPKFASNPIWSLKPGG